jgi:hypothetical protein
VFQTLGSRDKKVLKFSQSAMFNSCSRRQADLQMQAGTEEIWNKYIMYDRVKGLALHSFTYVYLFSMILW